MRINTLVLYVLLNLVSRYLPQPSVVPKPIQIHPVKQEYELTDFLLFENQHYGHLERRRPHRREKTIPDNAA